MTEEDFKKTMTKVIGFIIFALVILIIIGIVVFSKPKKVLSIFNNQEEIDAYKKKVEEVNSQNLTENEVKQIEENGKAFSDDKNINSITQSEDESQE